MAAETLLRYFKTGAFFALIAALLYFFTDIFLYTVIALLIALISRPIVSFLTGKKIGNWAVPPSLAAVFGLFAFLAVFIGLFALLIPMLASQLGNLAQIDTQQLTLQLEKPLERYEKAMAEFGLQYNTKEIIEEKLKTYIQEYFSFDYVRDFAAGIASGIGSIFFGLFAILFIAFFFLQDRKLFPLILLFASPAKYNRALIRIYCKVKVLLRRYFLGLLLQILTLTTLITLGLWIVGVPNALLIGLSAGIINIIPYLGPIIGFALGVALTTATGLGTDGFVESGVLIGMGVVFLIAQLTDNLILQPNIFANSVKAHPLEIFIVILAASDIGGVGGMIVAVPAYTVLRVGASEFAKGNAVVGRLTQNL